MAIGNLDIIGHIQQRIPDAMPVIEASSWYEDETTVLDFGEYVGRPNENALMHTNVLMYFFANGWKVDAVISSGSNGVWESVATAEATNTAASRSDTHAESSAEGQVRSPTISDGGTTVSRSYTSQSGTSDSSGTTEASGTATQTTTAGGAPYWFAYQRIRLKRRVMKGEKVLNDMVKSFTDAYNEGRTVNNARYDELVALYALVLNKTEGELDGSALESVTPDDFMALAATVTAAIENRLFDPAALKGAYDTLMADVQAAVDILKGAVSGLPENWQASRAAEINRQFDNRVSEARATMVENGTYNGTVWPNVLSGFERDRQYALNDLGDKMVTLKVDTYGKAASLVADNEGKIADAAAKLGALENSYKDLGLKAIQVKQGVMESAERVTDAIHKRTIGLTELRNTVVKWMLDFMERREDEYPGLDQLATVAERLGYGEGASAPA